MTTPETVQCVALINPREWSRRQCSRHGSGDVVDADGRTLHLCTQHVKAWHGPHDVFYYA